MRLNREFHLDLSGGSNSSSHGTGTVFCCLLAGLPFQIFISPLTLLALLDTGLF